MKKAHVGRTAKTLKLLFFFLFSPFIAFFAYLTFLGKREASVSEYMKWMFRMIRRENS